MSRSFSFPPMSLRVKLALSYLGVALGAILIMAVAVSLATQSYFANAQRNQLQVYAEDFAQNLATAYTAYEGDMASTGL